MRNSVIRTLIASSVLGLAPLAPGQGFDWDEEVVDLWARIPVQEDGRVKPLATFARFKLIRYSGGSKLRIEDEAGEARRLKAVPWLLDCLFHPDRAKQYPTFIVPRFDVVDAIDLPHAGKKKRDRYSYVELQAGIARLFELGGDYQQIESKDRTSLQEQIVRLAQNVSDFARLTGYLEPLRERYRVGGTEDVKELFGGRQEVMLTDVLAEAPALADLYGKEAGQQPHADGHGKRTPLDLLIRRVIGFADWAQAIALFPPAQGGPTEPWLTLGDLINKSFRERTAALDVHYAQLARLQRMVNPASDAGPAMTEVQGLHDDLVQLASARGQYDTVPAEVTYYRVSFLFWAQWLFVVCFALVALGWLFPASRAVGWTIWSATWIPALLLITAIVYRCIIRGRPPVSTLYETILFITAVAVVVLQIAEVINRRRIAGSLGVILGAAGMFFANRYEISERADTMPTLVAVLDTNYWLATHVTCITVGYAASLLAAALAHLWLFGKLFVGVAQRLTGRVRNTGAFFRSVARMTYGAVCFGLLFAVVGTILGGVWANDSWGRFWGWDPKENGALMICLWQLVILHTRLGSFIRHFGLAILSVLLGVITVFSWWHVNHLGVGLHSYGFTDGILGKLYTFYGIELLVLAGAFTAWFVSRMTKRDRTIGGDPALAVQAPRES